MPRLPDQALPALHRDADASSLAAQRQFNLAAGVTLVAPFLAAVFGAMNADGWGYAAALAFVAALAGSYVVVRLNPERSWYDGRAVAESAKTLAWQYSVGGGDFPRTDAGPESDSERDTTLRLVAALGEVRQGLGEVVPVPQGEVEQVTSEMRSLRADSLDARRQAYRVERIDEQAEWYGAKSRSSSHGRLGWGVASAVLQALGLIGALLKAAGVVDFDLLGIAAAGALAAAGWLRAKDFSELARAYAVAASELGDAKVKLDEVQNEEQWAVAVRDAESAISREHTRWGARRHHRVAPLLP